MEFLLMACGILSTFIIVICIILLFKNENTYKNHTLIDDAIYLYQTECVKMRKIYEVTYDDMEDYRKTCYRLNDWGYENILPRDKFEIIKPYIRV